MSSTVRRMIARREALGWSPYELARQCQLVGWSVTRETIRDIEREKRRLAPDELPHLARALRVDPNWLVGWDESNSSR